jgi:outer membrane protein
LPEDLNRAVTSEPVITNRSELKQLGTALNIRQSVLDMNRRYAIPRVYTFVDLGSQAFNWDFTSKSRYLLAGVQVNVPIFTGLRNKVKISTSKLEISELELTRENTTRQFSVAAGVSRNNLNTAMVNHTSSQKQYESALAYFHLIETGYSEGINSLIEFMDARNQLTGSEIQVKLNWYKVLSAYSDLKRQTANSSVQ